MEPTRAENRDLKRVRVQFPIGIIGDLLDGKGEVLNLSTGGCRVRGDNSLKQSPYLRLLLHPPNGASPIKVELAVVRWVSGEEYGLQFIRMNADHQTRLRQFLRLLEMGPVMDHGTSGGAPAFQPA